MKKISIIAVLLAFCLLFAACKESAETPSTQTPTDASGVPVETEPQEITFSRNGVTVTLPGNFTDFSEAPVGKPYAFLYADPLVGLFGIEESKETVDESVTSLETYAAYRASLVGGEAMEQDGLWTLSYEDNTQNEVQNMVCAFYETESAYWTIQSYCTWDCFETSEEVMWSYVKAVTFE